MMLSTAITALVLSILSLIVLSATLGLFLGNTLRKNKGTR